MPRAKLILLWVMALAYILGGFNHLVNPEFYVGIIPPNLPNPEWLNLFSGLAETVLGVFLLEPRTRVFAAWGIIALLIAVFPANLSVVAENGGAAAWGRLPFQALFIAWAWWYTREQSGIGEPVRQ